MVPNGALAAPGDADDDFVSDEVDTVATTGTIVSTGKTAYQSSNYNASTTANRAVDGNRAGAWNHGPIATTSDTGPWWEVDLGRIHTIDSINIYNRTDCCADRLSGATVIVSAHAVGDVGVDDAARNAVWSTTIGTAGALVQLEVPDRIGRYVRVQLPETGSVHLQLAEVDVMGFPGRPNDLDGDYIIDAEDTVDAGGTIVSTGKSATQSSVWTGRPNATADAAVDDLRDGGRDGSHPIAITDDDEPWWEVDLDGWFEITGINLYNRTDGNQDMLTGAVVMLASQPFASDMTLAEAQAHARWSRSVGTPGDIVQLDVPAEPGRYLRVQLPSGASPHLGLAEVDVIASPSADDVDGDGVPDAQDTYFNTRPIVSLGASAQQSSNYASSTTADRAVDGNRDGRWSFGPIATTADAEPWWEVDLGDRYEIDSITVFNRTDCCTDRLSGAIVTIADGPAGDVSFAAAQAAATWSTTIADAGAIEQLTVPDQVGRYVRIQLPPGSSPYLQLAEVNVHGTAEALGVTAWPFVAPTASVDEDTITWNGNGGGWQGWVHSEPLSTFGLIPGTDFSLSFVADHAPNSGETVMLGLGETETSGSFTDIDYAIYHRYGVVMIYESGANRGSFGTYTQGDTFSIEVTGTTVTYRHNDAVLRTTTASADVDWYVDTAALGTAFAQLSSITIHPS
ncbi:MAG: discoidin domain-containing protein [Actinomycetota bacterium]